MSVKFSMIIPSYNRAHLIMRTIESALAQNYKNFEIIVVDDGSKDDTEKLFAQFQHPQLRYFKKANGERGAARNFGALQASGEYLNFFDSDDLVLPNHFEEAFHCVQELGSPEVFSLGLQIKTKSGKISKEVNHLPDPMNDVFLSGNPLGCNPVFVRKDIFAKCHFEEDRRVAGSEDMLLWLRLASRYKFRFWPRISSVLLDHEDRSVYNFSKEKLLERNNLLLKFLESDPEFVKNYGQFLGRIRAYRYIYIAVHLALQGERITPGIFLFKAALADFPSIFQRGTLGAIKQMLLGFFRKYSP
jgi:glycosyltransferase involved in cell wall biosynthesis